jgi:hypothetical protein
MGDYIRIPMGGEDCGKRRYKKIPGLSEGREGFSG